MKILKLMFLTIYWLILVFTNVLVIKAWCAIINFILIFFFWSFWFFFFLFWQTLGPLRTKVTVYWCIYIVFCVNYLYKLQIMWNLSYFFVFVSKFWFGLNSTGYEVRFPFMLFFKWNRWNGGTKCAYIFLFNTWNWKLY